MKIIDSAVAASSVWTVRYMRRGLDTIPITSDFSSYEEACVDWTRLKQFQDLTMLQLLRDGEVFLNVPPGQVNCGTCGLGPHQTCSRSPCTRHLTPEWDKAVRLTKGTSPDPVNHPPHYTSAGATYETIKVIEAWGLGFYLGNTVKYISRAGKKDPAKELEDLQKARWYLDRAISRLESGHE